MSIIREASEAEAVAEADPDDADIPYKDLKTPLTFKDIDKILEYPTRTPQQQNINT